MTATAFGLAADVAHAQSSTAHLIVGDPAAAKLHVYAAPELRLVGTIDDLVLGSHAGAVSLADGRILIPDDRNKQLVVLRLGTGGPMIERRVPLPSRYAWAAVDPRQQVFVATALDSDEPVKLMTVVDLATYEARQFRVDTGGADAELNLAIGGDPSPVVLLHLGEQANAYRVGDLMAANARINGILDGSIAPASTVALGKGGHSNSYSPATKRWTGSTLRGFEVATLAGGTLADHTVVGWDIDGRARGRNARQRLTADGRHAFGPLAAALPAPRWAETEVDLHWVDLATLEAKRMPLARGAVGRGGVSARFAVYANIHPDGDRAILIDVDPASPAFRQVVARVPLAQLANGPVAGSPTAGRESRHSAILPDGRWAFVSHGGEGKISVIDTASKAVARVIETPTPLKGGGYLIGVQAGVATADWSAR